LKLTLVSPGGVRRILKQSDPLDTNTNGIYFTYDMGKPSLEALDGFNGSRLNGDWTLIAEDADVLLNNGFFQDWSLFAKYEPLDCSVIPCPDTDPCAPNPQCVNNECVYTSLCDDNLACTVDYCDPATHACRHDSIAGTGCPCENHDQCDGEACLESTKTRTCNPDLDLGCACAVIPGDVFEFGGLPDGIPDFNAGIELSKSLVVNSTKRIQDIRVRVKTSHPAVGNLRVRLTHGTSTVTLRNLSGGSVQGFHDIYDYDVVAGPGSLSDFTGLPAGGLWTLTVADRVSLNEGVLERVTLYIENAECVLNADCDDGIGCTADVCSASVPGGKCTNLPVVCGVSANPCEAFECDAADGMCKAVDLADGLACEDSVYCTVGDTCLAGVCTGGTIRDCSELNGICVVGVCNAQSEIVRSCLTSFTNGADCSDGELCTVGDKCNAVGQCVPGLSSGCLCPGGLDSECVDDGNKCNGVDWKCDIATFRCQLQDPLGVECGAASGQCSIQVCESDTGLCREQIKPNNTPCDDGLWCTIGDRCTNGFCVFDGARDCSTLDVCKTSTCSDTSDTCEVANKDDTTPCMVDGGGCGVYTCIAGGCTLDRPLDCAVEDPSTQDDCNDPLCTPVGFGGHTCSKVAKGLDSLGEPYPCMTDGDDCTSDICDAGRCVHLRKVNCWGGSCGGAHQFDEGDLHCGDEDYCSNGINLDPNGLCFPLPDCIAPGCVQLRSSPDLPIDDQILPDGMNRG
jgi:subtilisin-like proprotein convertase family protein